MFNKDSTMKTLSETIELTEDFQNYHNSNIDQTNV